MNRTPRKGTSVESQMAERRPGHAGLGSRSRRRNHRAAFRQLMIESLEGRSLLSTFSVVNTNDNGTGSLRWAIQQANANPGADVVDFHIPGSGTHSIAPLSALPAVTEAVTIDGTTQPGYSFTLGVGPVIPIEISGASAGALTDGLHLTGNGSVVRGLIINQFGGDAVVIDGSGVRIEGCYLGVKGDGVTVAANGLGGIAITNASNNTIGTNSDGVNDAQEGNLILGNGGAGVSVTGSSSIGNAIRGNSISGNAGLGIDLGPTGVTANDTGDVDSGPNSLQNFPVIAAARSGSSTLVSGTLNSAAAQTFVVDFYASTAKDSSGYGEGQRYLGSTTMTREKGFESACNVMITNRRA